MLMQSMPITCNILKTCSVKFHANDRYKSGIMELGFSLHISLIPSKYLFLKKLCTNGVCWSCIERLPICVVGNWGIVREGLHHMAIPCGWGWGGAVSDHPPLYCDLCPDLSQPSTTSATAIATSSSAVASSSSSNFPKRLSTDLQRNEGDV